MTPRSDGAHMTLADRLAALDRMDIENLRASLLTLARDYEERVKELEAALQAMVADIQDEEEAHEAEDEGFIVAAHVPYGDVIRARAAIAKEPK